MFVQAIPLDTSSMWLPGRLLPVPPFLSLHIAGWLVFSARAELVTTRYGALIFLGQHARMRAWGSGYEWRGSPLL